MPQLGTLLIQRGLLSEQQLATALDEQRRSGRPLGETLVRLGFVPGPVVGQALATQHGGLLKTEYGFATGFGPEGTPAPAVQPPTSPPASVAPTAAPRPAPPVVAPAPAPAAAPPPAAPAPDPRDEELRRLRERIDQSEKQLASARDQAAHAGKQLAILEGVHKAARDALASATAERDAAQEELAELRAAASAGPERTPEAGEPGGFLALVPTSSGYRLLEIDGVPPSVGTRVQVPEELGAGVREVLSVAGSPLPASALRCVHLI